MWRANRTEQLEQVEIGNALTELEHQLEIDWQCLKIIWKWIDVAWTSIGHELTELENNVDMTWRTFKISWKWIDWSSKYIGNELTELENRLEINFAKLENLTLHSVLWLDPSPTPNPVTVVILIKKRAHLLVVVPTCIAHEWYEKIWCACCIHVSIFRIMSAKHESPSACADTVHSRAFQRTGYASWCEALRCSNISVIMSNNLQVCRCPTRKQHHHSHLFGIPTIFFSLQESLPFPRWDPYQYPFLFGDPRHAFLSSSFLAEPFIWNSNGFPAFPAITKSDFDSVYPWWFVVRLILQETYSNLSMIHHAQSAFWAFAGHRWADCPCQALALLLYVYGLATGTLVLGCSKGTMLCRVSLDVVLKSTATGSLGCCMFGQQAICAITTDVITNLSFLEQLYTVRDPNPSWPRGRMPPEARRAVAMV